jgi:hypothetical protein
LHPLQIENVFNDEYFPQNITVGESTTFFIIKKVFQTTIPILLLPTEKIKQEKRTKNPAFGTAHPGWVLLIADQERRQNGGRASRGSVAKTWELTKNKTCVLVRKKQIGSITLHLQ